MSNREIGNSGPCFTCPARRPGGECDTRYFDFKTLSGRKRRRPTLCPSTEINREADNYEKLRSLLKR